MIFESYKALAHTHPKQFNMYLLFATTYLGLYFGRGAERLICHDGVDRRLLR